MRSVRHRVPGELPFSTPLGSPLIAPNVPLGAIRRLLHCPPPDPLPPPTFTANSAHDRAATVAAEQRQCLPLYMAVMVVSPHASR